MKLASLHKRNKKAISALIAEVLLISLSVVMAGMVYTFLKFYASKPLPTESCPEGLSLIVQEYTCSDKMLNITFKNQGTFDINKVIVKINNESGETAANPLFETIVDENGMYEVPFIYIPFQNSLAPGDEQMKMFNYSDYNQITLLEIEPTKGTDKYGREILCDNSVTRFPVSDC